MPSQFPEFRDEYEARYRASYLDISTRGCPMMACKEAQEGMYELVWEKHSELMGAGVKFNLGGPSR